jgi:ribonuclease BN (tRNA processing enzyme)
MEIIFLGTGGGRVNVTHRFRSTSGFVILGSKKIYVDPGPGVVEDANRFKVKLNKIDAIFVSHPHLDHANDMNVLIEAMTNATNTKRGLLFAAETVIKPTKNFGVSLSDYHKSLLDRFYSMRPGKEIIEEDFKIKATKAKHDDTKGIGFVLEMDGKRMGYTGDTEYFKGLGKQFTGVDVLIINILRADEKWKGHLDKESCLTLLKEARPKLAVLTRFGGEYIRKNPNGIAKWLEKNSGVRVVSSYDGMKLKI